MERIEKTKNHSVKKNYIYNVIYQVFALIVPLITAPFIARVLSAEGVGQYSFTNSLQSYFTLFAAFGFGYYAQREIANERDDKFKQSKTFWELIIIRSLPVSIAVGLNCVFCFSGIYGGYTELMWWWTFLIGATEFDISFLFQGNEEFGKIVIRNVLVKIISVACIFVFVKTKYDVWIYVLLTSISTLIGNLSLWSYLPKYVSFVKLSELRPLKHFVPAMKLFIPTIATSLYTMFDKTLIGVLITDTYTIQEQQIVDGIETTVNVVKKYSDLENGYYEQSEKIVKICMTVITALGTVMIPRNTKLYSDGKLDELKKNFYFATNFVWTLGIPMMFGLAAISPNLIPWFLGSGYDKCILLMQLFTPLVILIGMSNVFGIQYLIPTKRDKKFTIGILAGCFSNLILDLILIPFFWSYGAVIASLIAEFLVTFTMWIQIRKEISILSIIKQSITPLISGLIMFIVVYLSQMFLKQTWYFTFLLIIEGIFVYFVLMVLFKNQFLMMFIKKISIKFKRINKRK